MDTVISKVRFNDFAPIVAPIVIRLDDSAPDDIVIAGSFA
jgi:hypothetical protein